jgi:hypothetical protein
MATGSYDKWILEYAGVVLPIPLRDGVGFELQPVGNYERNAYGDMLIDHVALKKVVRVTWDRLNGEQATLLFSALESNRSGVFKYYDVSTGDTGTFDAYYGAGARVTYRLFRDDMTVQRYTQASVNFIEV